MPRRQLITSHNAPYGSTRQSGISSQYNPRSSTRSSMRSSRTGRSTRSKLKLLRRALPGYLGGSPFPPVKNYRLHYEEDIQLTVGASGVTGTQHRWSLNNLHDPNVTGSGHQPYGWDALKVAYNRYKVNGCFVKLEIYNIQTISAIQFIYGITNPSEFASFSFSTKDPEELSEKPMAESVIIQNVGAGKKIVKFYMPIYKAFQVSKLQYMSDLDNTTASTDSYPGSQAGLNMAVADPNDGSSGSCRVKVSLTYYATLYQREIMAQS